MPHTFVDYVNDRIEARKKHIAMLKEGMTTRHLEDSPSQQQAKRDRVLTNGVEAADVAALLVLGSSAQGVAVIDNYISEHKFADFTVSALYKDYILWLIANDQMLFPIHQLLGQVHIIASYHVHALNLATQKRKNTFNVSRNVPCPAVPPELAQLPDHTDAIEQQFTAQMQALDKTVYQSVVKAMDDKLENLIRKQHVSVALTSVCLTAATALWIGLLPTTFPVVPVVLGLMAFFAGTLALPGLQAWINRGRVTEPLTTPEPMWNKKVAPLNDLETIKVLKREAIDTALANYKIDELINGEIQETLNATGIKDPVTATTHCFIAARFADQYKNSPTAVIKEDNGRVNRVNLARLAGMI